VKRFVVGASAALALACGGTPGDTGSVLLPDPEGLAHDEPPHPDGAGGPGPAVEVWSVAGMAITYEPPPGWGTIATNPGFEATHEGGLETLAAGTFSGLPESTVEVMRWDAKPKADDPDDPFGQTAAEKQAGIDAFTKLYSSKGVDHLTEAPQGDERDLKVSGLFWHGIDYAVLVHDLAFVESNSQELRGVVVVGSPGQDAGFYPHLLLWIGRPTDRLVIALDVPISGCADVDKVLAEPFEDQLKDGNKLLKGSLAAPPAGCAGDLERNVIAFARSLSAT
jgi:hypothetical protein